MSYTTLQEYFRKYSRVRLLIFLVALSQNFFQPVGFFPILEVQEKRSGQSPGRFSFPFYLFSPYTFPMTGFMLMLYIFLQKYLVPFLFSVGLFYFIYGVVEYFIIGKGGDEGRMQNGRALFLKAIGWFTIAIIVHVVVLAIGRVSALSLFSPSAPRGSAGVEINRNRDVLEVPNVPTR